MEVTKCGSGEKSRPLELQSSRHQHQRGIRALQVRAATEVQGVGISEIRQKEK
jgi:hypothetical protein